MTNIDLNVIELKFDDNLEVLAGNPFGVDTYKKQLKDKFDINKKNKLIFPSQVDTIASSFVQGIMAEYLKKYSIEKIKEAIVIDNQDLYDDFMEGLIE